MQDEGSPIAQIGASGGSLFIVSCLQQKLVLTPSKPRFWSRHVQEAEHSHKSELPASQFPSWSSLSSHHDYYYEHDYDYEYDYDYDHGYHIISGRHPLSSQSLQLSSPRTQAAGLMLVTMTKIMIMVMILTLGPLPPALIPHPLSSLCFQLPGPNPQAAGLVIMTKVMSIS